MTPAPSLNTFTPRMWARVVSPVTWAEYGVSVWGQVAAKATRGPVIVWAKPGEEEGGPRLGAPVLSPLEVEAARINLRAHALAFARVAHGKVRHSVRWKTRRKVNRKRYLDGSIGVIHRVSVWLGDRNVLEKHQKRLAGIQRHKAYKRARSHQEIVWQLAQRFGIEHLDYFGALEIFEGIIRELDAGERRIFFPATPNYNRPGERAPRLLSKQDVLHICRLSIRHFGNAQIEYFKTLLSFSITLWRLSQAAERTRIAGQAQAASRRTPTPRPLYARPRPPTCPLAPPLA